MQPVPIANLAGYAWPLTNEAAITNAKSNPRYKTRGDPSPDPSCCGSCDSTTRTQSENVDVLPEPLAHSCPKPTMVPLNPLSEVPQTTSRLPDFPHSTSSPLWGPFTFYDLRPEAAVAQMGLKWLKHVNSSARPERTPRDQPQVIPDLQCLLHISPLLTACKCCLVLFVAH